MVNFVRFLRFVSTTDHFDKCSIGCGPDGEEPFCGQTAALYVFSESINALQANSLFCLGPSYQSCFRHEAETDLSDDCRKVIFLQVLFHGDYLFFESFMCKELKCIL